MTLNDLPSIEERLENLNPTKELLKFYRDRLIKSENDNERIFERLGEFKLTCNEQFKLENDLLGKDEEIAALRKALSDIQACLYQEREHVLRLYAENDRLKIRELEDRKKIQQLLSLCSDKFHNADLVYMMKGHPNSFIPQSSKERKFKSSDKTQRKTFEINDDFKNKADEQFDNTEFFKLQIEALRAELEDQTKLSRENIEALSEDCRITREESDAQFKKHTTKIQALNEKLKFSQELLQKMTGDYLDLKRNHKNQEMVWLSKRDEMTLQLNALSQLSNRKVDDTVQPVKTSAVSTTQTSNGHKQAIQALNVQLEKSQKMLDSFKTQCLILEDELRQIKEEKESTKTIHSERSQKLVNQVKILSSKYKDLERRHRFEVAGFRSDIKILRSQLQKVEKQLLKTALKLTQGQDDEILENIHTTTTRSKYLSDNLRSLKAQIYQLEQDLRLL